MNVSVAWSVALVATVALAGCAVEGSESTFESREIHLRASITDLVGVELYPGLQANLWAYCFEAYDPDDEISQAAVETVPTPGAPEGCSVPGPTLRVQQGDHVRVTFENRHVHAHSIHWHGQHTPWESDGVPGVTQDNVAAGESFEYEFIAKRAGTLWYHCHVDTAFHVMQGLYGAFVVEPRDDSQEPDADRDQVLVISEMDRSIVEATPERLADPHADHRHTGACGETGKAGCQNPAVDIQPDVYLLNGVSAPNTFARDDTVVHIAPGERVRLRILNAGNSFEALHAHGHDLTVTHIDGIPLGKDHWTRMDTVPIAPGQRIDAFIDGSEEMAGIWVMHTHVTRHVTNDQQYPGGILTAIVYDGFEAQDFASNLPGGQPYTPPPVEHEAVDAYERHALPTGPDVEDTWSLDVNASMAGWLRVVAEPAIPSAADLDELSVRVVDPAGDVVWEAPLDLAATWEPEAAWAQGTHRVEVTGTSVETWVSYQVHLEPVEAHSH